ncbi:UNVERIFIED_CONTAM: Aspartate aminotransferase [Trichonephila clavipes]
MITFYSLFCGKVFDNQPFFVFPSAYRDEEGRPWVLPVVREVEEEITSGNNLSHEYLGQLGLEELSSAATKLLLGSDSIALKQNRAFGVQTVGGTGALRVGADFLVKCAKLKIFYMADPCWPSHHLVFPYAGFAVCRIYRYWHSMKKCLDIEGLLEDLRDAPPGSVVILHVCAHNPTGIDPSKDQWFRIADVMQFLDNPGWALVFSNCLFQASLLPASVLQFLVLKTRRSFSRPSKIWPALSSCANLLGIEDFFTGAVFIHSDNEKHLFPFFDCAYQGIASGDLEKDAWPVRYFVSRGFELLCAQSFSKNMGLYSERVGNLTLVFKDSKVIPNVRSHITMMIRGNYCNPPRHGAGIATRILNDNSLIDDWKKQLKTISIRIKRMRWALRTKLQELGTPGNWDHITRQIGMFCYSGLTEQQVKYLIQEYHIYLPTAARINICGLNDKNVEYVARAINDAVITFPSERT